MTWQDKIWGRTRELVDSEFYSKHELEIKAGGYCSIHYHQQRANRFVIVSGLVEIVELIGPLTRRTILGPENTYDVPSLVPHLFITHKSGQMFEEYYPDRNGKVKRDDIVRLVEGGLVASNQIHGLLECLLKRMI